MKTRQVHGRLDIRYHVVDGRDLISNTLRRRGVYEPELLHASAEALQHLGPPQTARGKVIDVGANLGTYALPLAKVYPQLELVCFEPQRPIHALLCQNIELNRLGNVATYPIGLSDTPDQLQVTLPDYATEPNIGAFSLDAEVRANDYEVKTQGEAQIIELSTLDSFGFREVRLIKLDVEGLELAVLRGAQRTLSENGFPALLFEAWAWKPWYAERRRQLIAWVEALGYRVRSLGAFNHLAQHERS